jgi:hypothetical protein
LPATHRPLLRAPVYGRVLQELRTAGCRGKLTL